MAAENAADTLSALKAQWEMEKHRQTEALAELQAALSLSEPPNRIECYDISNTQGTYAVGSMVVFEQGVPKKALYRRFNIRSVIGPDDFASMEEVLTRRFNRWQAAVEQANTPGKKPDPSFARLPDLLIVDGGKGQLSRGRGSSGKIRLTWQGAGGWPGKTGGRNLYAGAQGIRLFCRAIRRVCIWFSASATKRIALQSRLTATGAPARVWLRSWIPSPVSARTAVKRSSKRSALWTESGLLRLSSSPRCRVLPTNWLIRLSHTWSKVCR